MRSPASVRKSCNCCQKCLPLFRGVGKFCGTNTLFMLPESDRKGIIGYKYMSMVKVKRLLRLYDFLHYTRFSIRKKCIRK